MGKRPAARQGSPLWVTTADLPTSDGHPFFERLNRVLEDCGFDSFVEGLCSAFYTARLGRPSLRPGRYFRMLLTAWKCDTREPLRCRGEPSTNSRMGPRSPSRPRLRRGADDPKARGGHPRLPRHADDGTGPRSDAPCAPDWMIAGEFADDLHAARHRFPVRY